MRQCRHVHVLSDYTRRQLEHFHELGSKFVVVPHWQRPDFARTHTKPAARQALGWPGDRPILFTLRRHVYRMGLDVAIAAIAPLARAGRCRLMIGGDGPLRGELQRQAKAAGCGDDEIRFLGHVSDADLPLAYQATDLFVLPTRSLECFGLIAQEAMACGCPVLGTDVGAIPELLHPITPQLIVPPGDAGLLRERVEQFLAGDLTLPDEQVIAADTEARYGRERVLPKLLELLERRDVGNGNGNGNGGDDPINAQAAGFATAGTGVPLPKAEGCG
jgi:glycosyltransferase involved in cell wall biosynthesis